uniref:Uncharacterized protein n=1 Tax=Wuchereria bancrofti TaxID=6293 RepID=A0A1I8EBY2_WUCBA
MILCGSENKRKFKQRAQLVIIAAVIVAFIESFIKNQEEPRSVFVFVLLGVSATVMITSLTLILLIRFGVIFQQPMRSSLQRGQIDEAL